MWKEASVNSQGLPGVDSSLAACAHSEPSTRRQEARCRVTFSWDTATEDYVGGANVGSRGCPRGY